MAFEAKHEEFMTSLPPTSHLLRSPILGTVLAAILALGGVASSAGTASARTIYDGAWSVLIVTQSGSCDPSYRYGVQIADGAVVYDGAGPITLQGKVILQAGSQWADGSGKLTRNRGGGVWKGQGMSSACAGTWQAERRE